MPFRRIGSLRGRKEASARHLAFLSCPGPGTLSWAARRRLEELLQDEVAPSSKVTRARPPPAPDSPEAAGPGMLRMQVTRIFFSYRELRMPHPLPSPLRSSSGTELLAERVRLSLLHELDLESVDPHDPIVARHVPRPWSLLGRGNYAAVLTHPEHPEWVVKVYAPGRSGIEQEAEVYRRLGSHPAYSECVHVGENFLVLRRLHGVTLYDALHRGVPIPRQAIRDIDRALRYAKSRGLHPHDVHGKNVMVQEGRGLVLDVSDFLDTEECTKWRDLRKAYFTFYRPFLLPLRLRVPYRVLDAVRWLYRRLRRVFPAES